jgi:hypothetical protein
MTFIVTVKYNPGSYRPYVVASARDRQDAIDAVLREIGYHPGVPIVANPMTIPAFEALEQQFGSLPYLDAEVTRGNSTPVYND